MFESEGDFKLKVKNPTFQNFVSGYNLGHGNFKGMALVPSQQYADVDGYLSAIFRNGGTYYAMKPGDPKMDDIVDRQRRETDKTKRIDIVKEWQRYMATKFYDPVPGSGARLHRRLAMDGQLRRLQSLGRQRCRPGGLHVPLAGPVEEEDLAGASAR